ncbi:nuclear distribution protein PAC1 [Pyronema domesticum]|uniref:Nuclear distribution protein PAC1 n=1 Tax=Pyronema omphalodes (strain CBS 100304) TaxID=1076935 RepID=U4L9C5_PYROM|nr:nuclear distribution protein PAC1 [Pyronema domesticum]CCX15022.1 Similar to Nuclear distribution protein PAC1; acc. no. D5GBI7 [Pyronema omphalodes CBS 100304]
MSTINILAPRQKDELHKSILAYLNSNGLPNTCAALREELDAGDDFLDETKLKKYEGLLEKKWTSVVRLQKKIMELESRINSLQTELDSSTPTSLMKKNSDPTAWLPRGPARHKLTSHRLPVTCVAFHPVFSVLASGSEDQMLKIWDWELGELEMTIKGHTKAVLDVDFGGPKNGILLASCSSDLTIKLWDPANDYKNIRTLTGHDHSVSAVRFIPSAAGEYLVSASRDKTLRIWEVATGYCIKTIQGHVDWIRDVTPSFDGRWLLSAGNDQTARLWDTATAEHKATFLGHEHVIECCVIAPPSAYPLLSKIAGLKKPPPSTSSLEFIATGSRDKTIKIWDARGTLLKTLTGHDNWVRGLVFHPGGKYLLSASDDKTIRCWDLEQDCRCVKVISDAHEHFVSCIRWAPAPAKEPLVNGDGKVNGINGAKEQGKVNVRCVIATGSVDYMVRVFAS